MKSMTREEFERVAHALGVTGRELARKPYARNSYCAEIGDKIMREMVEKGYVSEGPKINGGRDQYYIVTEEGIEAMRDYARMLRAEKSR